jgi:hypothetical protein
MKKLFCVLVCASCVFVFTKKAFAADVLWSISSTYIIPDDGDTWYMETTQSLTDDFVINGVFEVRSTGTLQVSTATTAGGNNNATDGTDVTITNNGTLTIKNNGTVIVNGGAGGTGANNQANAEVSTYGGAGGKARLLNTGSLNVEGGGFLNIKGGTGGAGGSAVVFGGGSADRFGMWGGDGGMGWLNDSGTLSLSSGANLVMDGGNGGAGNNASYEDSGYVAMGGPGGRGGAAKMNSSALLSLSSGTIIKLNGGTGGNGGASYTETIPGGAISGDGGGGGDVIWIPTGRVDLEGVDFSIYEGDGGDEGSVGVPEFTNAVLKGGVGGYGGNISLQGTFNIAAIGNFKIIAGSVGTELSTYGQNSYSISGTGGGTIGDLTLVDIDTPFNFYDSVITLSQNLDVDFTWTISADKQIYGNGNSIILGPSGEIVVDPNLNLYLQNLSLDGVTGFEIRCLDDSSSITLDDVTINLDGNLSFTEGMLVIKGTCIIDGAGKTFLFQSSEPLLILNGATLKISPQVVFEYDTSPASLLQFGNSASTLFLDSSTLLATQALTLQTGTLSTDGLATLQGVGRLSFGGLGNFVIRGGLLRLGNVVI